LYRICRNLVSGSHPVNFPQAKLHEAAESHRRSLLLAEEVQDYCKNLFVFKKTIYKRYRFAN
jgi:hypothetical protein